MCLAIPMKLTARDGERGTVETSGVRREIMLTLTPGAAPGDYLIVHAGYALEIMDGQAAQETMATLRAMEEGGE